MPRFLSGGREYEMVALDEISGRNLLTFSRDASEVMGRPIRFVDVERIAEEIDQLPDDEAEQHPDLEFLSTVIVWVSRLAAGDTLTYGQCLDEPFAFIDEPAAAGPKDRLPKQGSSRRSSAAASGGAGGRARKSSTTPTRTRSNARGANAQRT